MRRHRERTLNYSDVNGVRTAWSLEGPDGAPVIVLANGLGADSSMWTPQMGCLTPVYRVLRYDMRGHGWTDPTPGDYSLKLLASDIWALLVSLQVPEVHFIGNSLGGMVGQFIGIYFPTALISLTLCGTSSSVSKDTWTRRVVDARAQGVPAMVEATLQRWFTPFFKEAHRALMDDMRAMILRTSKEGYAACAAAIRDMDIAHEIHRIQVPTLVIAGEDDFSTPLSEMEAIAREVPNSRLVRIPRAAHMPTIEQPDLCNEVIRDFLATVESSALVAQEHPRNGAFRRGS